MFFGKSNFTEYLDLKYLGEIHSQWLFRKFLSQKYPLQTII
jgi:hypothetical protein